MSGIVNSSGSRSGVIGTTELDYEEGTWTPIFEAAGGGNMGVTSSGFYTVIGNICIYGCTITVTSAVINYGAVNIKGWPFTATQVNSTQIQASGLSGITAGQNLTGYVSGVSMRVSQWNSTTGTGNIVSSRFPNSTVLTLSGTYHI